MADLRIFNPNIYRPAGGSASPQPNSFSSGWLAASPKTYRLACGYGFAAAAFFPFGWLAASPKIYRPGRLPAGFRLVRILIYTHKKLKITPT
jgi:hypothetical protein